MVTTTQHQFKPLAASRDLATGNEKSPGAFRTISEVASELDVPQHVLRFWESKFVQIKPLKRGGGRRYYRPEDITLLRRIRNLLYSDGYTIKGVQRLLREGGIKSLIKETRTMSSGMASAASSAPMPAPFSAPPAVHEHTSSLSPADRRSLRLLLDELESLRVVLRRVRKP